MSSGGWEKTPKQNALVESSVSQVVISSPVISGFTFRLVVGSYCPLAFKTGMVWGSLMLLKYEQKFIHCL